MGQHWGLSRFGKSIRGFTARFPPRDTVLLLCITQEHSFKHVEGDGAHLPVTTSFCPTSFVTPRNLFQFTPPDNSSHLQITTIHLFTSIWTFSTHTCVPSGSEILTGYRLAI